MSVLAQALAGKYNEHFKVMEPYIPEIMDSRIVEEGENANGQYVRWENGLQMCTRRVAVDTTTTSVQIFTFPASFASDALNNFRIFTAASSMSGKGSPTPDEMLAENTISAMQIFMNNGWDVRTLGIGTLTGAAAHLFAFGRWK